VPVEVVIQIPEAFQQSSDLPERVSGQQGFPAALPADITVQTASFTILWVFMTGRQEGNTTEAEMVAGQAEASTTLQERMEKPPGQTASVNESPAIRSGRQINDKTRLNSKNQEIRTIYSLKTFSHARTE